MNPTENSRTNITQQIRSTLRTAGIPMSLKAIGDANGWTPHDRRVASAYIKPMVTRGEVRTEIEDGKPAYASVPDFAGKVTVRPRRAKLADVSRSPDPVKVKLPAPSASVQPAAAISDLSAVAIVQDAVADAVAQQLDKKITSEHDRAQLPLLSAELAPIPDTAPAPADLQALRIFIAHRLTVAADGLRPLLEAAIEADCDKPVLRRILAVTRELGDIPRAMA